MNENKKPEAAHDLGSRRIRNDSKLKVTSANSLEKSMDAKKKLATSLPRKSSQNNCRLNFDCLLIFSNFKRANKSKRIY